MSETHAFAETPTPDPTRVQLTREWLHRRLFDGVWNSLLTVLAIAFLVWAIPPIVDWLFLSAVWGAAPPEACRAAEGACWAMVHDKYRLIIFGRYPYMEQWRPFVGMLILIAMIGVSCRRAHWKLWLAGAWLAAGGAFLGLMWGGFLGLTYIRTELWGGLPLTMLLAFVGIAAAFPLSIVLALGRRSKMPVIRAICVVYIEFIRGVPLISVLFMASVMLPLFLPEGVTIAALLRAQIAIILFSAAYLAEVIRGGLQAIPRGQVEAAESIGLSYWQTQRMIVLPQAIRLVIPPIVNTFIGLFKDTSLVAIVSLTDLLLAMRQAVADPAWRVYFVEGYLFIALIYFLFCYFMSKYSQYLERDLHAGTRRS
ncbi:MAG: amino acid ABC transporter permease [Alphaproteobacteria bacterium]